MKQKLLNNFRLRAILLVAMLVGAFTGAWAESDPYYTLDTTDSDNKTDNNGYASTGTVTVGDIGWSFDGNGQMYPWRLGGKSLTGVDRAAYTTTAMGAAISSIDLTVGSASSITVNSLTLIVASDDSFETETIIDQVSESFSANSTITFEPTSGNSWAKDSYYKFVFNVTVSGKSNKFVEFSQVDFYEYAEPSGPTTYSVTYNDNGAESGTVPTDETAYSSAAEVTVLGNTGNLAKAGYIFGGWNTQANGEGTNYAAGDKFAITANTTLYAKWNAKTITGLTKEGTPTKTTYVGGESFNPAGLTITATFNDNSEENVTNSITWNPSPLTAGTTSVTGTYMGLQIVVDGLTVTAAPGTAENPYTVAQAIAAITAGTGVTGVYVQGIVSQVDSYNSTYKSITYWISVDGTTTADQFEVYSGKGIGGADFSSMNDVKVGDVVIVYGNIKLYNNSIYEFDKNNQLVSLVRPASITLENYEYDINANGGDAVLPVTCNDLADDPQLAVVFVESDGVTSATYSWISASIVDGKINGHLDVNTGDARTAYFYVSGVDSNDKFIKSNLVTINQAAPADPSITVEKSSIDMVFGGESDRKMSFEYESLGNNPTFEVCFFEADGETAATYDWVTTATIEDGKVNLSVAANTGEARSAYFKVHAVDTEVYSNLVTINQAAFVVDYATLPFKWDDKTTPTGVTNYGVSTYTSSPYLKFDGTGDYIILKLNEAPGYLLFDIKGNSFSGGTFKVQTSADGKTYEDLESYTSFSVNYAVTEGFNLNEDVRYIKWIYTSKSNGNVALGNIKVATARVTVGATGYATFSSTKALDFTDSDITAYIAVAGANGSDVQFTQVTKVPANTGVLLFYKEGKAANDVVPALSGEADDVDGNLFVAVSEDVDALASQDGNNFNYILNKVNDTVGFYRAAGQKVAAGKAYISVAGAGVKSFFLPGMTDGIQAVEAQGKMENAEIYNLAGQRVNAAKKGIYVINGKKVMVK